VPATAAARCCSFSTLTPRLPMARSALVRGPLTVRPRLVGRFDVVALGPAGARCCGWWPLVNHFAARTGWAASATDAFRGDFLSRTCFARVRTAFLKTSR